MTTEVPLAEILSTLASGGPPPAFTVAAEQSALQQSVTAAQDALSAYTTEAGPDVESVTVVEVPVDGTTVRAQLFTPLAGRPTGGHVYLHGGSFSLASAFDWSVEATCRERCAAANVLVLAVDYRKAPEHQFPSAVHDSFASLAWLAAHIQRLGLNPGHLSLGGGSSGGNLAAAAALLARDQGGPLLRLVLLEGPALDLTGGHLDNSLLEGLDPAALGGVVLNYLGDLTLATDPLASPLLATDLSGLPPFHIMTAELDALRGDGEAFIDRLCAAGVSVTGGRRPTHVHTSPMYTRLYGPAREWRREVLEVLAAAHASRTDSAQTREDATSA